jgi:hypothetical protein
MKGRNCLEYPGVDWRMVLKQILIEIGCDSVYEFIWLSIWSVTDPYEHGNEPFFMSVSIFLFI